MSSGSGTDLPRGTQKEKETIGITTRANTKKGGNAPGAPSDVNTAIQGRRFLEKHLLLCPTGEPFTHTALSTSLHQISMMSGATRTVANAVRAIAFLVDELKE